VTLIDCAVQHPFRQPLARGLSGAAHGYLRHITARQARTTPPCLGPRRGSREPSWGLAEDTRAPLGQYTGRNRGSCALIPAANSSRMPPARPRASGRAFSILVGGGGGGGFGGRGVAVSVALRLGIDERSAPSSLAPILLGFALHGWRCRILTLHPVARPAGDVGRPEPL
jgi:hypothetical protein